MSTLSVRQRNESLAVSFKYIFEPAGWAIFTFNNSTGELFIQSDWGNYTHRWIPDPQCLGAADLEHFFVKAGANYLAEKLGVVKHQFDGPKTRARLRKELGDRRNRLEIAKSLHKVALDAVNELDFTSETTFAASFLDCEPIKDALGHADPWSEAEHSVTSRFRLFVDQLLPFFLSDMRERTKATTR